jgi:carboxyl-terminal processing protease
VGESEENEDGMMGKLRLFLLFSVFSIVGLTTMYVAVSGGPQAWAAQAEQSANDRYMDYQIFTKVLNLVQQYYVEEVDTKKLIYGGIKGMLKELDPHTNFLPPEVFREFESETSGEFGGVGIEITVQDGVLTVIAPIEDTPAWNAGVKAGDKVVEIEGESTKGLSLAEAAQRMRGKRGSRVHMKIFREGFEAPKEFVLERSIVKVKSVKYTDLGEGYAYVRLTSFIENSSDDLEKVLRRHMKEKSEVKGLILDLRRNPGGLLDQAIKISDLFLTKGVIVSTIGRNKKEKEVVYAKEAGTLPNFPVIVLINEYSASASEILAGALQDNKRALIMGKRSFGKGSVQSVVKLGDGSALKLTVARYYTPSGISIQSEGIKPDIALDEFDPETMEKAMVKHDIKREQDMAGHLIGDREKQSMEEKKEKDKEDEDSATYWWSKAANKKEKDLTPKERLLAHDYQLTQAYNYLKAWKIMHSLDPSQELTTPGEPKDHASVDTPADDNQEPAQKPAPAPVKAKKSVVKKKKPLTNKATPVVAPKAPTAPKNDDQ